VRAHVGDVWLWLCRAACPGPGVHVWRRGLSPPTPNPSLCVVKETESGEARAALTIKGVSGLQSSEFRVVHLSQDVRHRAPALPRERALAAERRQRRHVGRSVRAPDCNSIATVELLSQPGLTHARADAPEPEASDRRAPPPMGTHCASRWAARPSCPSPPGPRRPSRWGTPYSCCQPRLPGTAGTARATGAQSAGSAP